MLKYYPFQLRSTPTPTIPLPIACRSVGHYSVFPGWHNPSKVKSFVELFWGIKGKGAFRVRGRIITLHPNEVFTLYTGERHHVTSLENWEYRWMTLDGLMPDAVVRGFGFGEDPIHVGPCPSELFERLSHEIVQITPQAQRSASATAYEILSLALPGVRDSSAAMGKFEQCLELIRCRYGSVDLNITTIAQELGIHRSTLSKLFRENMTMSPIEYLISFRVGRAIKLLQESDLPVRDVALAVGFACPNYFANVMRQKVGLSPSQIRTNTRDTATNL